MIFAGILSLAVIMAQASALPQEHLPLRTVLNSGSLEIIRAGSLAEALRAGLERTAKKKDQDNE